MPQKENHVHQLKNSSARPLILFLTSLTASKQITNNQTNYPCLSTPQLLQPTQLADVPLVLKVKSAMVQVQSQVALPLSIVQLVLLIAFQFLQDIQVLVVMENIQFLAQQIQWQFKEEHAQHVLQGNIDPLIQKLALLHLLDTIALVECQLNVQLEHMHQKECLLANHVVKDMLAM